MAGDFLFKANWPGGYRGCAYLWPQWEVDVRCSDWSLEKRMIINMECQTEVKRQKADAFPPQPWHYHSWRQHEEFKMNSDAAGQWPPAEWLLLQGFLFPAMRRPSRMPSWSYPHGGIPGNIWLVLMASMWRILNAKSFAHIAQCSLPNQVYHLVVLWIGNSPFWCWVPL